MPKPKTRKPVDLESLDGIVRGACVKAHTGYRHYWMDISSQSQFMIDPLQWHIQAVAWVEEGKK